MDAASDLRVVIALCTLTKLLDVAGPLQIFTDAGRWSPGYEVVLVSEHGGPTATDTVLSVQSHPWSQIEVRPTDIVVVPGGKGAERDRALNAGLIAWLREVGNRVRTVASTCTGAFLLAEAGLLDGRRAVTHWDDCHKLRAEFPAVQVEDDPIYVADGPMWTSAGVTAGMDLSLALVERDHGRRVALRIARNLVMQAKRGGGQSQFSAQLRAQVRDAQSTFDALHGWVSDNLTADLRVESLAKRMAMSPRTFHRSHVAATGITPARMVRRLRVDAARRLLEGTDQPVKAIAASCGFGTEEQMRRSFHAELKLSPSAYRDKWCWARG